MTSCFMCKPFLPRSSSSGLRWRVLGHVLPRRKRRSTDVSPKSIAAPRERSFATWLENAEHARPVTDKSAFAAACSACDVGPVSSWYGVRFDVLCGRRDQPLCLGCITLHPSGTPAARGEWPRAVRSQIEPPDAEWRYGIGRGGRSGGRHRVPHDSKILPGEGCTHRGRAPISGPRK